MTPDDKLAHSFDRDRTCITHGISKHILLRKRSLFGNPHLDCPIHDFYWVGRDIYNRRHLHCLTSSDIELAPMARTDDVEAFNVTIAYGTIIVRADITNGKVVACDVEDH